MRALTKRDALLAASRFDDAKVVNLRGGDGGEITSDKRDALLAAVMAGEHVELRLEVLAYEQEAGKRNKKSVRIRDGAMLAFGRSAKGRPFLKNHDQHDVMSRGGTILDSATEKLADGHYVVRQNVSLTAPWACEMALRGLLDALSVNITPTGPVLCSVHGTQVFESCYCFRGDEVEDDDGNKQVVEWIYDSAETVETSAVNVPAVPTAHIESIRSALMLGLQGSQDIAPTRQPTTTTFTAPRTAPNQEKPMPKSHREYALHLSAELRHDARAHNLVRAYSASTFAPAPGQISEGELDASFRRGVLHRGQLVPVDPVRIRANLLAAGMSPEQIYVQLASFAGQSAPAPRPAQPAQPTAATLASSGSYSSEDLDAALMRLGIKPERIASMKGCWKAAGMSDADINRELSKMIV